MGSTKHKASNSFSTTLCNSILYQKAAAQRTSGDRTQKAQGFWLEDRSWLEAKWSTVYGYGNHKHRGALSSIVPSGMMCVDYRCTKDAACAQTVAVVRMDIYHLARYLLMLKGRQLQPTVTIIHVRAILRLGLGSMYTVSSSHLPVEHEQSPCQRCFGRSDLLYPFIFHAEVL